MEEVKKIETLYRVNYYFEDTNDRFPRIKLYVQGYEVDRYTNKGCYIILRHGYNGNHTFKWVSLTYKSRFAYPTKEQAMVNFKFRSVRRLHFLKKQTVVAEQALELIKTFNPNEG